MASLSAVKLCYECIHAEMEVKECDGETAMINTGICRALGFKHASQVYDSTLCRFAYKPYEFSKHECNCCPDNDPIREED